MRIDALEIRAQGTAQGEFAHDRLTVLFTLGWNSPRDPRLRLNARRVLAENIWLRPTSWLGTSLPDCT